VILKGLDYAAARGAQIVNMSFAGPKDALIERGIAALAGKGEVIAKKGDRRAGAEQLQTALRLATDPKDKESIQAKLRAIGVGPL